MALLVAVVAVGLGMAWYGFYRTEADVPAGRQVTIRIAKGASAAQVASQLARAGVVENANMFQLRVRSLDAGDSLLPGTYVLRTGSEYDAVIGVLRKGPTVVYHTLTIPEGFTIDQIAARVEAKLGIPADEFKRLAKTGAKTFDKPFLEGNRTPSLEGYLFPKTYQVRAGASARQVIEMMLDQYGKEIASTDFSYAQSKNLTPHEVLTIASIIEREASVAQDRPLVASVIYNRLKGRMKLQLDSTVMYVIGNRSKLYLKDLKVKSPYNTYLNAGLPPGPICNPGLASIEAAARPESTGFLYYIMDHKDGTQSFATTYDQFLALKARLKRKGLK